MQAINLDLYNQINALPDPWGLFTWFAAHGASLGAVLVTWVILRYPKERWYAGAIILTAALASGLAHTLADMLDFERPYMVGLGAPSIPHGARGALPSAHATVMFCVALLLCLRPALRLIGVATLLLAIVTSWGRVQAGVHFPFDVAAGVLLALVLGTAAHLFLLQLRRLLEFLVQGLARRAGLLAVREVPPRNR